VPRRKSISNSKVEDFEPRKKNPLGLLDDANLDAHLKSIKIGDKLTPVKLSDNEVRFDADFSLNGKFKTHLLETDNQYMHLQVNNTSGYIVFDSLYTSHVDASGNYPLNAYNAGQGGVYIDHNGGSYVGGIFTTCGNGAYSWGKTSSLGGLQYGYSYNGIRLLDKTDTGDYCQLSVSTHGATTLSTVDDDAAAGHLTLDADGNTIISILDGNESGGGFHVALAGAANRAVSFSGEVDNNTTFRMYEMGGTSTTDYLDISTFEEGQTTISTVDGNASAAHLLLDADGRIIIDSVNSANNITDGTLFRTSGTTFCSITSHHAVSSIALFEAGGSSTDDYFEIYTSANGATDLRTVDAGGHTAHLDLTVDGNFTLDPRGEIFIEPYSGGIKIKESADAIADTAGYGQIWVHDDTPNTLWFTTDAGDDIQITSGTSLAGGGGTTRWTRNTGGYITNKTSTTLYYFQFRPNSEFWSNSDSSPTSINQYDAPACQFHAPADGTLTNIAASGYVNDTGAVDPFKFYVYKGTPTNDATSTSLTLIGTSAAPAIISSAARTFSINTDISSSNSFSAGDAIFIMWKKDSNTGSQDVYFSITISGEYS